MEYTDELHLRMTCEVHDLAAELNRIYFSIPKKNDNGDVMLGDSFSACLVRLAIEIIQLTGRIEEINEPLKDKRYKK